MEQQIEKPNRQMIAKTEGAPHSSLVSFIEADMFGKAGRRPSREVYYVSRDEVISDSWVRAAAAPVANIFEVAESYALLAKRVISEYLTIFFKANRTILEAVYLTKTEMSDLHYSIVLKDDIDENRARIFSILDDPEVERLSSIYPIFFQFYPQALKDRIQYAEVINL